MSVQIKTLSLRDALTWCPSNIGPRVHYPCQYQDWAAHAVNRPVACEYSKVGQANNCKKDAGAKPYPKLDKDVAVGDVQANARPLIYHV